MSDRAGMVLPNQEEGVRTKGTELRWWGVVGVADDANTQGWHLRAGSGPVEYTAVHVSRRYAEGVGYVRRPRRMEST